MKAKELNYIQDTVEDEGFGYAFLHYSDFEEIQDEEFHRLRLEFELSAQALADYLNVDI